MNYLSMGGVENAIVQIILNYLAIIIVSQSKKWFKLLILAAFFEIIIDAPAMIDKGITHNMFFVLSLPLIILLLGFIYEERKLMSFSLLFLASAVTDVILMDGIVEHDYMRILYPLTGYYASNLSITPEVFAFWMIFLFILSLFERMIEGKTIRPLSSPLSHNGIRFSRISFRSPP